MESKAAFVFNYGPHYRAFIYKEIENNINCSFYFGTIPKTSIKKMDYTLLNGFVKEFKTIKIFSFFWYIGVLKIPFLNYDKFILTGDVHILSNWVFMLICKLLRKDVFLWSHGWYGNEKGFRKYIKILYFKLSDGVFVYGNYSRNNLIKLGFKKKDIITIYNSLNYNEQLKIRNTLVGRKIYRDFFVNDNPVLIYIGRVQRSKKLELLFESMDLLRKNDVFVNLMVIGQIDAGYDIKKYVTNSLKDNVCFYGPSYDESLNAEFLFNAKLCVSPGNVGLTAIHSLMFGTPVITHNSYSNQGPEFEVVENGVTGLFFNENNVMDLANVIEKGLKMDFSKNDCYEVIDTLWNPNNQVEVLKQSLFNK